MATIQWLPVSVTNAGEYLLVAGVPGKSITVLAVCLTASGGGGHRVAIGGG